MNDPADDRDNVVPMGWARPRRQRERWTPYGERLARIEAQLDSIREHGATKDDISKVKIWFLGGVPAAIGLAIPTAVGVTYAVARLFAAP